MSDTTTIKHLRAIYENGVFRPFEPVTLDEHREVTLSVIDDQPRAVNGKDKTCLDLAKELGLIGIVKEAPSDLSTNKAHFGTSLDDFLKEENILEEANARSLKKVLAWQIEEAMKASGLTKTEMASRMGTSRAQLNRLLDPDNESLTLSTLASAAAILGKQVELRLK